MYLYNIKIWVVFVYQAESVFPLANLCVVWSLKVLPNCATIALMPSCLHATVLICVKILVVYCVCIDYHWSKNETIFPMSMVRHLPCQFNQFLLEKATSPFSNVAWISMLTPHPRYPRSSVLKMSWVGLHSPPDHGWSKSEWILVIIPSWSVDFSVSSRTVIKTHTLQNKMFV